MKAPTLKLSLHHMLVWQHADMAAVRSSLLLVLGAFMEVAGARGCGRGIIGWKGREQAWAY